MKFLLLIFLFGLVAANFDNAFRNARDEILESYREGLKSAPSLSEALDLPYTEELDEIQARFDADTEDELKDKLDKVVGKMKDAVDKGKEITQDIIDKFQELKKKLKEKGGELHDKAKEMLKEVKETYKEWFKKLFDKIKNKRSLYDVEFSDDSVDDVNTNLDKVVEKMKDAIDKGHQIGQDLIDQFKELKKKLKEKGGEIRDKVKTLMEKMKQKYKEMIEKMFDKLKKDRRAIEDFEMAAEGFSMKEIFNKIREKIKEHMNMEKMMEFIKEKLGDHKQIIQVLIDQLKEHGMAALKKFIDELLGRKEARSLKELWDRIKDYFNKLGLDAKEKYLQFLEWMKERKTKALENAKTKMDKMKIIAKEFIEHHKEVSKEVALEALEFFRPYKEDLEGLWKKVKDSANDVMKNKQ